MEQVQWVNLVIAGGFFHNPTGVCEGRPSMGTYANVPTSESLKFAKCWFFMKHTSSQPPQMHIKKENHAMLNMHSSH